MKLAASQHEPNGGPLAVNDIVQQTPNMVAVVDCGYGSVKATSNQYSGTIVFPAGASPADQALGDLDAEPPTTPLFIDGKPWRAGFETAGVPAYDRPIHQNYATTDHYRALLMEALHRIDQTKIDLLVLGLPTDLYLHDQGQIEHLKAFKGEHVVYGRSITVEDVVVCNQPLGSATAFARRRGRIGVIDIGYRTTDTTVLVDGRVDPSGHSTCPTAARDICEAVARSFQEQTNIEISADMVDQQFRTDLMTIERRLISYDLRPHLDNVAPDLAKIIWSSIQTTLRLSLGLVDQFLLTGGGAHLLRKPLEKLAGDVPVTMPPNPATANIEGYLQLGQSLLRKRAEDRRHG
ncbi:MAG: hypothetical protein ACR2QF_17985 [Geminicoccaceae bacterium]